MTNTKNIIRVHRPELTDEERALRMAQIKKAAERLLLACATKGRTTK
jgi:ribosome recycling factor